MLRIGSKLITLQRCHYSSRKLIKTELITGFDKSWRELSDEQKSPIAKQYTELEKQDWHSLSLDQKRAIYTIAYGPPEVVDPYEKVKVASGVVAVVAAGLGFFAFIRMFANPAPKTIAPEYQRAQEEYLRSQNANPIFGLSSQKPPSIEDIKV